MASRKKLKARVVKVTGYRATRYKRNPGSDDLYDALKAAGCQLDSHESDLYVRDTAEARAIIARYKWARPESFVGEGQRWIELPFCYSPFWRAAEARGKARGNPRRGPRTNHLANAKPGEFVDLDAPDAKDRNGSYARHIVESLNGDADEQIGDLELCGWIMLVFYDVPTRYHGRTSVQSYIIKHDEQGFYTTVDSARNRSSIKKLALAYEKRAAECYADADIEER